LYKEANDGTVLSNVRTHIDIQDARDAIDQYVNVPMGISAFPEDLVVPQGLPFFFLQVLYIDMIDWARTTGNLKYYHRHGLGGHFAARC